MAQGKGGAGARPEFKRARFQEPDPNLCANNIPYTGTIDWFAANGDEIYGTFAGYLTPTGTPGVYDNHETADVTGGTGRFTSATGHWESGGQVDFTTEPISFVTPSQGWINFHRH